MHGAKDVGLGWLAHGVVLVVRQENHVLSLVAKVAVQIRAHVLHVVDAATQLAPLTKVIDTYEQRLPPAIACRILVRVPVGGTRAKVLGLSWRWWRAAALLPLVSTCTSQQTARGGWFKEHTRLLVLLWGRLLGWCTICILLRRRALSMHQMKAPQSQAICQSNAPGDNHTVVAGASGCIRNCRGVVVRAQAGSRHTAVGDYRAPVSTARTASWVQPTHGAP